MHAAIANTVPATAQPQDIDRYARCIEVSKRIRWDIDRDVIRGRSFDFGKKFMPDGLSKVDAARLPRSRPKRACCRRSRAAPTPTCSRLVERFIGAKTLEIGRDHCARRPGRARGAGPLTDEELKHQELFRRLERMAAVGMPTGYGFLPQPDEVAGAVLSKSNWAVLGLTLDIELFSQAHYRSSIEPDDEPLGAVEGRVPVPLEGGVAARDPRRARMAPRGRAALGRPSATAGVDDLIELVGAVDGICQVQARADADYFLSTLRRPFGPTESAAVHDARAQGLPLAVHRLRRAGAALRSRC